MTAPPVLPSPSNFLAVALVINRSRDGPAFVFHYPANVLPVSSASHRTHNDPEADDHVEGAGEDILVERLSQTAHPHNPGPGVGFYNHGHHHQYHNQTPKQPWNRDEHLVTDSGSQVVPWEDVAGFPTRELASILTPARQYHKKLFQLSLDPLYCVSYPIHVPENGSWKKRKKASRAKARKMDEAVDPNDDAPARANALESGGVGAEAGPGPAVTQKQDDPNVAEDGPGGLAGGNDEKDDKRSSMTMFNLVFILNPKKHEVNSLVSTLHFNIIKKINKVYKYSQQHSEFVWKESKKILALKEKGREEQRRMSSLWHEILAISSLAASVQEIYEAVSQNRIAALQLDTAQGLLTPSFQIPIPFYVSDIPQDAVEDQRGLWLTTANTFLSEDAIDEPGFLDKNFALLLMDNEKKIIADLQADPDPTTQAMVEFVRLSKPTMSFYQVGQSNILTLGQVRKYAQHFIFWRRAIAIPPLHARDTYIVSPNCNASRLPRASVEWQKSFPLAPPLANFLADLSYAPRPYKHFCPSKAHRPTYLAMLAWLLRGGWVTQLCTFAYVIVWPEIVYEVEYQIEADELEKSKKPPGLPSAPLASTSTTGGGTGSSLTVNTLPQERSSIGTVGVDTDDDGVISPSTSRPATAEGSSDTYSVETEDPDSETHTSSSANTHIPTVGEQAAEKARLERIADKVQREAAEKATAHARKVPPRATTRPSANDAPHLAKMMPHIILDAKKAAGRESLYLAAIERRFRDESIINNSGGSGGYTAVDSTITTITSALRPVSLAANAPIPTATSAAATSATSAPKTHNVGDAWPKFLKYFNGQCALERIALQEEIKRKEAWALLSGMSEYLLCVRHW